MYYFHIVFFFKQVGFLQVFYLYFELICKNRAEFTISVVFFLQVFYLYFEFWTSLHCGLGLMVSVKCPYLFILQIRVVKKKLYKFFFLLNVPLNIYSGYGKYSDPLKFCTLCYIAAIC